MLEYWIKLAEIARRIGLSERQARRLAIEAIGDFPRGHRFSDKEAGLITEHYKKTRNPNAAYELRMGTRRRNRGRK